MANSENIRGVYSKAASSDAVTSPEDLQHSVEEFGEKLRELKERESYAPNREWLEDAERWHQRLRTSLEDYRRERAALQYRMVRAQQLANEAAARRDLLPNYESLQECLKTAGQTMAEGFRKSRGGLTKAFNRAFGRNRKPELRPGNTKAQEADNQEERRRASGEWITSGY
jgi:NADH dehydrogenase/NADH:ubiquinone oxidoreductase subunit G